MQHILLANSFKYKSRKKLNSPTGFFYDKILGAWLSCNDKTLLVKHSSFPAIGSKKEDIETGEDQKGH